MEGAFGGHNDMSFILTSPIFKTDQVNDFYYNSKEKKTFVELTHGNSFDGYENDELFSVFGISISTFDFFSPQLETEIENVNYFVTDTTEGNIIGGTNEALEWLFGSNINNMISLKNAKHNFNNGMSVFQTKSDIDDKSYMIITDDDNKSYLLAYNKSKNRLNYILWGYMPYELLSGSSWSTTPTLLHYNFSSTEIYSSEVLCINNHRDYEVNWSIDKDSTRGIEANETNGVIKGKSEKCILTTISVSDYLSNKNNEFYISISPFVDISTCNPNIVVLAEYTLMGIF